MSDTTSYQLARLVNGLQDAIDQYGLSETDLPADVTVYRDQTEPPQVTVDTDSVTSRLTEYTEDDDSSRPEATEHVIRDLLADTDVDNPAEHLYRLVIVDLFCGAGGFSTGMVMGLVEHYADVISAEMNIPETNIAYDNPAVHQWLNQNIRMIGVNHWELAVKTFKSNHPWATVHNSRVGDLHPPDAVDGWDVDILLGGPSCVPYSKAKAGPAADDQRRFSPFHIHNWVQLLRPTQFMIENVEGFKKLGGWDDDGSMIRDGSVFRSWKQTFEAFGYSVAHDTLYAHHYGDAQSRKRLFVVGRRHYQPEFPDRTHSADGTIPETKPYRTAAEIIEWSDTGESLWGRSRPLVNNTNQRIAQGLREYGPDELNGFADVLSQLSKADVTALQEDTVSVTDVHTAVKERNEPFLVDGITLIEPAEDLTLAQMRDRVADDTVQTDSISERQYLWAPQVMSGAGGGTAQPRHENQVPTIRTTGQAHAFEHVPFVLPRNGWARGLNSNTTYDPDEQPAHTITAKNHDGRQFNCYLTPLYSERDGQQPRTRSVDRPIMTIPASKSPALITQPYLVKYYGTGTTTPIDDPMPTITTKGSLALVVPEMYPFGLEIRYRMIKPSEAARAQGFPESYTFPTDSKTKQRELIGNAVPTHLGKQLSLALLDRGATPTLQSYTEHIPAPASITTNAPVTTDD